MLVGGYDIASNPRFLSDNLFFSFGENVVLRVSVDVVLQLWWNFYNCQLFYIHFFYYRFVYYSVNLGSALWTCVGLRFAPVVVINMLSVILTLCLPTGTAQFQSCHNATGCGGSEVTGVSTARDCCLGSGLSFRNGPGICRQCIGK